MLVVDSRRARGVSASPNGLLLTDGLGRQQVVPWHRFARFAPPSTTAVADRRWPTAPTWCCPGFAGPYGSVGRTWLPSVGRAGGGTTSRGLSCATPRPFPSRLPCTRRLWSGGAPSWRRDRARRRWTARATVGRCLARPQLRRRPGRDRTHLPGAASPALAVRPHPTLKPSTRATLCDCCRTCCAALTADPTLPRAVRIQLGLLLVYLALPIDLIPDFIPILGYADDAVVVALVLRSVARVAGTEALARHWPGTPAGLHLIRRLARLPTT